MTEPDNFNKHSKFTDELSEVRSLGRTKAPEPRRQTRDQRISGKALQIQALLEGSAPGDRRINLLRTALLRKDEAILDGLLEELRR